MRPFVFIARKRVRIVAYFGGEFDGKTLLCFDFYVREMFMTAQTEFLAAQGGRVTRDADGVEMIANFGDFARECDAFEQTACICDAADSGFLRFSGDDAAEFLNGQLSTNVKTLPVGRGGYTTYNSPKGRMLASFFLWRTENVFYAQLSADLLETIQKRLSMYVLRAKVMIENVSKQYASLGLCGRTADDVAQTLIGQALRIGDIWSGKGMIVAALSARRYLILVETAQLAETWRVLSEQAQPAGRILWQRAAILAAIPTITEATLEKLIPQAANWDALGGIDFNKGCYVGQEIIARTRYLGRVKERLYLARCGKDEILTAGTPVYSTAFGEQACGIVVNATPDRSGLVVLISMQTQAENDAIHAQTPDGAILTFEPLPYALSMEEAIIKIKP